MKKSQKNILKEMGKVLLTLLAVFLVFIVWANWDTEPEYDTTPMNNITSIEYMREGYMEECAVDNDLYLQEYCTCTFDYLKLTMGDSLFIKEATSYYDTGVLSPSLDSSMDEAIEYCL